MQATVAPDEIGTEFEFDVVPGFETNIRSTTDILTARQRGRAGAIALGFSGADVAAVAAAISEVTRNIVEYAQEGKIAMQEMEAGTRRGLRIVACDHGPGIPDVTRAMQYGYSTRQGLGVGLPGARWLMDEFNIVSAQGRGTTVTMIKWLPE